LTHAGPSSLLKTVKVLSAPLEDREAFFRFQSASLAFAMARDATRYILDNKISPHHGIHDPLVVSIVIHYGRPFKQRLPLRLSDDVIEDAERQFHDFLITCRDKLVAHTDLDGPRTDSGWLINELAGRTKQGLTIFGLTMVVPDLNQTLRHLDSVDRKVAAEANRIWMRYFTNAPVPDGVSIVNLEPGNAPFLIPHPNESTGLIPPMIQPSSV
jgi:hypothetical protein